MELVSRRLLAGALLGYLFERSALAQIGVSPEREGGGQVLVTLFLRGGMDGLSLVAPIGDADYHRHRKTIGLGKTGLKLDDFYHFHPAMGPLHPLFQEGKLAAIHAIGSQDQSRSHFEAMALMERGAAGNPAEISSGWAARWLAATEKGIDSPLRGLAFGSIQPDIVRGSTSVSTIQDLAELRLQKPKGARGDFHQQLLGAYSQGHDPLSRAGRETLKVLETLEKLNPASYKPEHGAVYPGTELGKGLKSTALLVKADVGLEMACLDRHGWDTHVGQNTPYLALQFADVANALAAFAKDLGPALDRVTVVVMTEFGRRVPENSGFGTDHGRASAWLVLGGGVQGGKVYGQWPGLKEEQLEGPGDLKVTTDYRDVLIEILARHGDADKARAVFTNPAGRSLGLFT